MSISASMNAHLKAIDDTLEKLTVPEKKPKSRWKKIFEKNLNSKIKDISKDIKSLSSKIQGTNLQDLKNIKEYVHKAINVSNRLHNEADEPIEKEIADLDEWLRTINKDINKRFEDLIPLIAGEIHDTDRMKKRSPKALDPRASVPLPESSVGLKSLEFQLKEEVTENLKLKEEVTENLKLCDIKCYNMGLSLEKASLKKLTKFKSECEELNQQLLKDINTLDQIKEFDPDYAALMLKHKEVSAKLRELQTELSRLSRKADEELPGMTTAATDTSRQNVLMLMQTPDLFVQLSKDKRRGGLYTISSFSARFG